MKCITEEKKLTKFCLLAEEVAEVFLRKIRNNFLFEAKLKDKFKIGLVIPEGTKNEEFELIFAHELAHLAFDKFLEMNDYCETDKSYANSSITRKVSGKEYGKAMEEGTANFLALNIVSIMNNCTYDDAKKFLPDYISLKDIYITEKIINFFAKEPFKKDDYFDQIIMVNENYQVQKNPFLSEAISGGTMSSVIADYDDYMGNGAWKRLMVLFDVFSEDNDKNALSCIEAEIKLFYLREKFEKMTEKYSDR